MMPKPGQRERTRDVVAIRKGLRLTQERFGQLVHAHANTVCRWESGALSPDPWQERILAALEFPAVFLPEHTRKHLDKLIDIEGAGALGLLLVTPNPPNYRKHSTKGNDS